jgi:hypothetical protein
VSLKVYASVLMAMITVIHVSQTNPMLMTTAVMASMMTAMVALMKTIQTIHRPAVEKERVEVEELRPVRVDKSLTAVSQDSPH